MPIYVAHWRPFIRDKSARSGRELPLVMVDQICAYTEGHPSYTQQLCHAIWDQVDKGRTVRRPDIERGVQQLLQRESYACRVLWESLTLNQRRLLMALAMENAPVGAFSSAFTTKHALASPSSVQRAAKGLEDRDVMERGAKRYFIIDRFSKIWLRKRESA